MVKFDLFRRYGAVAAAGDRHLAEFCEGDWYLQNPEQVEKWGFGLTPVSWRKEKLKDRLARSERLRSGEEAIKIDNTGEEGVLQMRAILGLCDLVTNVNLPNEGQIPNLPLGAVVETNAVFSSDSVKPVFAGPIPKGVYALVARNVDNQLLVAEAAKTKKLAPAFKAFVNDPLTRISTADAKKLFDEMIDNTKAYLKDYDI